MTTVTDSELFEYADRVKDQVVLITGAANGLGKSAALLFGKHGAKVVIGDLDLKGAEEVVAEIKAAGGDAVAQKCDVTSWEQQLSLFQFAMRTFNRIDIVVPNAGVNEIGRMASPQAEAVGGLPTQPNLKTLEINLIAVIYTARLGLYYLLEDTQPNAWKAMVFIGSMSSLEGMPHAPMYSASKHALVGFMSALYSQYRQQIRFAIICPWFVDTAIIPTPVKFFMAGIPLTPISRVGGAIFRAASDPDSETDGAIWTLPDDGPVFRINRAQLHLNQGVYKLINDRVEAVMGAVSRVQYATAILKDLYRAAGSKIFLFGLTMALGAIAWYRGPEIRGYMAKLKV